MARLKRANKLLVEDWKRLKRKVPFVLNAESMETARELSVAHSRGRKDPWGHYYDVANLFIKRHVVQALSSKLKLSSAEKLLVARIIGDTYYAPRRETYLRKLHALVSLQKEGKRGAQIFEAIRQEYKWLISQHGRISELHPPTAPRRENPDMFSNPIMGPGFHFEEKSFRTMDGYIKDLRESIKQEKEPPKRK